MNGDRRFDVVAIRDVRFLWVIWLIAAGVGLAWSRLAPVAADEATATGEAPWQFISARDLMEQMAQSPSPLIVDVRHSLFFEDGHIPGAIHLPIRAWSSANGKPTGLPDPQEDMMPMVIYCQDASCDDSRTVAAQLAAAGYERIFVLRGGWEAWCSVAQPPSP